MTLKNQEFCSANTSVNSRKLPAIYSKIESVLSIKPGSLVFDVGGGKFNNAIEYMKKTFSADVIIYDKFNRTSEYNEKSLQLLKSRKADISVISNVLNVIKEYNIKEECIQLAVENTKKNGLVIIKIYEGNKSGVGNETKKNCWQENKKTEDYMSIFKSASRVTSINKVNGFIVLTLD